MRKSSRGRGDRGRIRLPGAVVADEGVKDVGAAAGQADGGRDRPFALVAFASVVGPRMWVAADRGQCRHVHYAAQSAGVAVGVVQASGAFARVSRYRSQSGPSGELVGRADQRGIADSGQELGTEAESHARQAGDHPGQTVAAKSVLDVGVGRGRVLRNGRAYRALQKLL